MSGFEYDTTWEGINMELSKMLVSIEEDESKILKEAGKIIKNEVVARLPVSEENHKHMKNDVNVRVKTSREAGKYVSVGGGKETGYKWQFVSSGYIDRAGKWHEGNHFVDKAMTASEAGINNLIDKKLKEVAE